MLVNKDFDNHIRWQEGERLDHLFERQCDALALAGKPDHIAVITSSKTYSFRDLDERANQFARHLVKRGMGAGDRIAVLLGNSFETYVTLLAIMKANMAYVPLDASFPGERIKFITEDAGIKAIVSLCEHSEKFSSISLPAIMIDTAELDIDQEAKHRLDEAEKGDDSDQLAYIIYTSGTTGNPKGVAVEHSSICNFVQVAAETYGYCDSDRVYQGMTIAFDFSVEELWVPLMAGAALVPGRSGASLVGSELHEFLLKNKVTGLCCVPTLLATMEEDLPDLRLLLVSGEACPHDLVVRWHKEGRSILNAYGPTEATVTATITELHPDKSVTIGGPLPTYTIVMLDPDEDKIVPEGENGEIGIAGIGLAREYLNHQELTAEKFIPDFLNLDNNPSKRIYRSGDLGRITQDDEIEYLGRIDTQVKIRGYRIELTEIESIILQMPQVAQAAVDIYEFAPGMKELVAYYSLTSESTSLDHDELANVLKSQLPNYMVPAYFEHLDAIPMTPSHKTDRKNLPTPKSPRYKASSTSYVAPKSEMEKQVAAAFAQVMKIEEVSIDDHFFTDLGAHSLLMAQFCADVRQRVPGVEISMREVYQNPTVSELVRHLEFSMKDDGEQTAKIVRDVPQHKPTSLQYFSCGALQLATYVVSGLFFLWVLLRGFYWGYEAIDNNINLYGRVLVYVIAVFLASSLFPIAVKWLLVGRWTKQIIPLWSLCYFKFWLVKLFLQSSPMNLFLGTPAYNVYLRLLGAKIGKNSVILSGAPVCTDLFEVGDNTLIRQDTLLPGYHAIGNNIHTGSIHIGSDAFVGSGSVLEIDTSLGNDCQLGHSSTLYEGTKIANGKHVHGTPAEQTSTNYCKLDELPCTPLRRWLYTLAFFALSMVIAPLPVLLAFNVIPWLIETLGLAQLANEGLLTMLWQLLPWVFVVSITLTFISMVFGLLVIRFVPKLLNQFIEPDKTYVLFGFHYFISGIIRSTSNVSSLNVLFGDSSYIVIFLKWIGYKLNKIVQTGANFGLDQRHDNPYLCEIGSGSIVSDGLTMANSEVSTTSFVLRQIKIGNCNYLGNVIYYPANGKTGSNILIATKAMIPVDGPLLENTGLLGSPSFEIPRASKRDADLVQSISPQERQKLLEQKNRFNLATMALFLASNWFFAFIGALTGLSALLYYPAYGASSLIANGFFMSLFTIVYWVLVERASLHFGKLKTHVGSMYDDYFLFHERHWKFTATPLQTLFPGTPFKPFLTRLMGAKIGRMVFDDGAYIYDKSLMEVGDQVNLNLKSILQGHSLEEGVFKSGTVKVGEGCTIGSGAFIHYSVEIGDQAVLEANSFLMKGETVPPRTLWQGNPARSIGEITSGNNKG